MKIFMGKRKSCDLNYIYFLLYLKLGELGELVENPSEADVIVFTSTCCGTEESIYSTLEYILNVLKYKKETATTILTGCITREFKNPRFNEYIKRILDEYIDYIVPEEEQNSIINIIAKKNMITEKFGATLADDEEHCAKMFISKGCTNQCSFCKTTYQKLNYKSVEFDEIKKQIDKLDDINYIDICGTNITQYGIDLKDNHRLPDIIKLLEQKENIKNIGLHGFAFKDAIQQGYQYELKYSKKISIIGGSIESGSNRILSLMNKGFTKEEFLNFWIEITSIYPKKLNTCIIAGFPTETLEDIEDTLNLLEKIKDKNVQVHRYADSSLIDSHKLKQFTHEEIEDHYKIYMKALKLQ